MLAKGFRWLAEGSGACREKMERWTDFGQKRSKVFVVELGVCSGRGGLMSGGLERWSAGECLGVVWKDAVSSGGGNCGVGSVGLQLAFRG